jgi:SAM-dependent methyltransferase
VGYWHCGECDLIFVARADLLSADEEKARYETHQNIEGDAGYEKFLGQLWEPLRQFLPAGRPCRGLDFGCGPGPALQKMIERQGHECAVYDPFYADEESVLKTKYDFVTCTEVAEHFNEPKKALDLLLSLVRPDGVLGVMTQFHPGDSGAAVAEFFTTWWYARDPAHVCFYSEKTLRRIFADAGFEILELRSPVAIARRGN